MLPVLSVTSECVPLVKTGGLADVAGALPGALGAHGVEMRTLLPGYPEVLAAQAEAELVADLEDWPGGPARILRGVLGARCFMSSMRRTFSRGPAGPIWDSRRAGLAGQPATLRGALGRGLDRPRRVGGLAPARAASARLAGGARPGLYLRGMGVGDVRTVLTIHNIAFQGLAPAHLLPALRPAAAGLHRAGIRVLWPDQRVEGRARLCATR